MASHETQEITIDLMWTLRIRLISSNWSSQVHIFEPYQTHKITHRLKNCTIVPTFHILYTCRLVCEIKQHRTRSVVDWTMYVGRAGEEKNYVDFCHLLLSILSLMFAAVQCSFTSCQAIQLQIYISYVFVVC